MSDQPRDAEWPNEWIFVLKACFPNAVLTRAHAGDILTSLAAVGALRTPAPATLGEDEAQVAEIEKRQRGLPKAHRKQANTDVATLLRLLKSRQPAPTRAEIIGALNEAESVISAQDDGRIVEAKPHAERRADAIMALWEK